MNATPYRQHILDHYQHPRHRGRLAAAEQRGRADNDLCGDWVEMELCLDPDGRVVEVAFEGQGCVISLAAASLLSEYIHGRGVEELRALDAADMRALLQVELNRARMQCALVPLWALRAALDLPDAE